jgi:plasmid stabilization system protein ParE
VTQVVYSRRALADLERLAEFLIDEAPRAAVAAIDVIIDGVEMLGAHPRVGRVCEAELRELVISYGQTGYVALYSYEAAQDVALILAIRHQREAGFAP